MPPLAIAGVAAGLSTATNIASGVIARSASEGDRNAAMSAAEKAQRMIAELNLPPDQARAVLLQEFKSAGVLTPELENEIHSQFEQIGKEDPQLREAQIDALTKYKELSAGGMRPEDRLALSEAKEVAARENVAARGDITREMAQRGQGGAGAELAMKLQAQQAGANELARSSERTAAQASQRALEALGKSENLAGRMRSDEMAMLEKQQALKNEQNRFDVGYQRQREQRRAANVQDVAEKNLAQRQSLMDRNVALQNQELLRQREGEQTDFTNKMKLAQLKSGAEQDRAKMFQERARDTEQSIKGIGSGIAQGIGSIGGFASGLGDKEVTPGKPKVLSNSDYEKMYAAHGAVVPGKEVVPGDHPVNDTVDAKLSPGEMVIPKTVAEGSDDHILGFIKGLRAKHSKGEKLFNGGMADDRRFFDSEMKRLQSEGAFIPKEEKDALVKEQEDFLANEDRKKIVEYARRQNAQDDLQRSIDFETSLIQEQLENEMLSKLAQKPGGNKVKKTVPTKPEGSRIASVNESVTPTPSIVEQQDPQQELRDIQENERYMNLFGGLTAAGEKIGSSIARTQEDKDVSKPFYQAAELQGRQYKDRQADLKSRQDLEAGKLNLEKARLQIGDETKLRDPKSEISVLARATMKKAGYPLADNASAMDLKAQGLDLDKIIGIIAARETRQIAAETAKATRDLAKAEKSAQVRDSRTERLAKAIRDSVDYKNYAVLKSAVSGIEQSLQNPSPQGDAEIVYSFVKILDPGSAVKENEVDFVRAARNLGSELAGGLKKLSTGQILLPQERQNILDIANRKLGTQRKIFESGISGLKKQAERQGISLEEIVPELESPIVRDKKQSKYEPGDIVTIKGIQYKVGADGDSLEEIQ